MKKTILFVLVPAFLAIPWFVGCDKKPSTPAADSSSPAETDGPEMTFGQPVQAIEEKEDSTAPDDAPAGSGETVQSDPQPEPPPEAEPEPEPVVPEETPVAIDWKAIAGNRAAWPKQTSTTKEIEFPIVINGVKSGASKVPSGTALQVVSISEDSVVVARGNLQATLPHAATDLEQRLLEAQNQTPSVPQAPPSISSPKNTATATTGTIAQTTTPAAPRKVPMRDRLRAEINRMRRARVEGGDFDDKIDRIKINLRITNTDNGIAYEGLKGTVYVLVKSINMRGVNKVLDMESFSFDLPPLNKWEDQSREYASGFDTTYATWGYQYAGWVFVLEQPSTGDKRIWASNPSWEKIVQNISLKKDQHYNARFEEVTGPVY